MGIIFMLLMFMKKNQYYSFGGIDTLLFLLHALHELEFGQLKRKQIQR